MMYLTACASSYHPMDSESASPNPAGFAEIQIRPGLYKIYYNANAYTSPEKTRKYWHQRAQELCDSSDYGYDLREDEEFDTNVAYAAGMVYASRYHMPRFYGIADCSKSGALALYRATRAERKAERTPDRVIKLPSDTKPISFMRLSCNSYYRFEQDCVIAIGAHRTLFVDGVKFQVAGNNNGDRILIQLPWEAPAYAKKYDANEYINTAYYIVEDIVKAKGLHIRAVTPATALFRGVKAYLVAVDGNGYAALKNQAGHSTPMIDSDNGL